MSTNLFRVLASSWILAAVLFTIPVKLNASHDAGGEIAYDCIGGTNYVIYIKMYRDCQGTPAALFMNYNYNSSSCASTNSGTANLDTSLTVAVPGLCTTPNSCNGGTGFGIERLTYVDTVSLAACSDWVISAGRCCRNAAITNLVSASSADFYVEATLNSVLAPCNDGANFTYLPDYITCLDSVYTTSFLAWDGDSDSIAYSFVDVLGAGGTPIAWQTGYTVNTPINSSSGNNLNATTGELTATPQILQHGQMAVKASEYRAGNLIGSSTRDIGLWVVNCSTMTISSAFSYTDTGYTFTFTDLSSGATSWFWDFGDSNTSTVQNPVHTYNMQGPFTVCLTVSNGCNTSTVCQVINVCVDCVWPGDANNDGIANNFDIMNVGIAMNDTGPSRDSASTAWIGQMCNDWADTFSSGLNYKFADCDGNGEVKPADIAVISLNYGLTHSKSGAQAGTGQTDGLYLTFDTDTSSSGDTVMVTVNLGDNANPVNDIYGVALTMTYNVAYVDSLGVTVDYSNSWIGTGADQVNITYDSYDNGFVDMGIVRTDHTNVSGFGEIARVNIVIEDNIDGKRATDYVLTCHITDELVIDKTGAEVTFTKASDSVVISSVRSTDITALLGGVSIFPNPATQVVHVDYPQLQPDMIQVVDVLGRVLVIDNQPTTDRATLDVSALQNGLYFVQVTAAGQVAVKRLMVLRSSK